MGRHFGAAAALCIAAMAATASTATSGLAACTVLATVCGVSPVGNTYTAGLPADVAAHLQATAWETVQSFKQPV